MATPVITTLETLELRNKDRRQAGFFEAVSHSFHLVAANLTHLFLPVLEPQISSLLRRCTSLTSLVVPVDNFKVYGHLVTIVCDLPRTATLTHLTMCLTGNLAPELLLHILELSNEGEPAQERQRSRLAFGLISRAFFLATAGATEVHVDNEQQAKALVAQLERAKERVAQEERQTASGRTSGSGLIRVTRLSSIRHLSILIETGGAQTGFVELLRATPNLVALDLVIDVLKPSHWGLSPELGDALEGLVNLQKLQLRSDSINSHSLPGWLSPLKALEVLDLDIECYAFAEDLEGYRFDEPALPHLRKVRIQLEGQPDEFPNNLLETLASHSTNGIQNLELLPIHLSLLSLRTVEPLLRHLTSVVAFTWGAFGSAIYNDTRGAVLKLVGAMESLQSIKISMWTLYTPPLILIDALETQQPIDHTLFDTLATLPSLQTVKLAIEVGILDSNHVIAYLESHKSLRSLSIEFSYATWTREERDAVEEAADQAGVSFVSFSSVFIEY
ncbi:hypothetical protein RQP46_011146 [Phenoliferia psychrophenolica]